MSKLLARVPIKPRTPQLDREAILSSSADRRSCWGFDCFYGRLTEFRDSTTSLDESRDASKSLADCEFLEARPDIAAGVAAIDAEYEAEDADETPAALLARPIESPSR